MKLGNDTLRVGPDTPGWHIRRSATECSPCEDFSRSSPAGCDTRAVRSWSLRTINRVTAPSRDTCTPSGARELTRAPLSAPEDIRGGVRDPPRLLTGGQAREQGRGTAVIPPVVVAVVVAPVVRTGTRLLGRALHRRHARGAAGRLGDRPAGGLRGRLGARRADRAPAPGTLSSDYSEFGRSYSAFLFRMLRVTPDPACPCVRSQADVGQASEGRPAIVRGRRDRHGGGGGRVAAVNSRPTPTTWTCCARPRPVARSDRDHWRRNQRRLLSRDLLREWLRRLTGRGAQGFAV